MKIIKNVEELIAKSEYKLQMQHENFEMNRLLNFWRFFEDMEAEIKTLTKESLEVILYSKYYWCSRYVESYTKVYGVDAGLEQQQYKMIEELEWRINEVDWNVIQMIEEHEDIIIPNHLKDTYAILKKVFPNGIDEKYYWEVLALFYEYMSDENLALIMSYFTNKSAGVIANDIFCINYKEVDTKILDEIKMKLDKQGLGEWKFIGKMLEFLPTAINGYMRHVEEYGEALATIVIEDIFMPEIVRLLQMENNTELLMNIFNYFEEVSSCDDKYLLNTFSVTVLEILGNDKKILETARKYMGSKTAQLQIAADRDLGRV